MSDVTKSVQEMEQEIWAAVPSHMMGRCSPIEAVRLVCQERLALFDQKLALINQRDAARKRISELEDNAARLEGRMGTALNRIRVLEDERDALREGLEKCITVMNRLSLFTSDSLGGMTALNAIEGDEALAAAQALIGKAEPETECECERAGINTDGTCSHCGGRIMSPSDAADIYAKRVSVKTGKRIQSPTERPIQAGDTVRHRTEGWTATVTEDLRASANPRMGLSNGQVWPLSLLERVETAEESKS